MNKHHGATLAEYFDPDNKRVICRTHRYRRVTPKTPEWEAGVRYWVLLDCGHTIGLAKGVDPQLVHACFTCTVTRNKEKGNGNNA